MNVETCGNGSRRTAQSVPREEGVRFRDGTPMGGSAWFLKSITFADVCHDGGVGRLGGSSRRSEIVNVRHGNLAYLGDFDDRYESELLF